MVRNVFSNLCIEFQFFNHIQYNVKDGIAEKLKNVYFCVRCKYVKLVLNATENQLLYAS